MRRTGLLMVVFGMVAILGSCASCGVALFRLLEGRLINELPLTVDEKTVIEIISVDSSKNVQLAVKADVRSKAIEEKRENGKVKRTPQYEFPVEYKVFSNSGDLITETKTSFSWKTGTVKTIDMSLNTTDIPVLAFSVSSHFEPFEPPQSGKIRIEFGLARDGRYRAEIEKPVLRIYDQVPGARAWLISTVILMPLGWAMIIAGLINNRGRH